MADRILPDLLDAAEKYGTPLAKQSAAALKAWDRDSEADSRGGVLFYHGQRSSWDQLWHRRRTSRFRMI
jgi:acyl-homoserine-lactone acylase